MDTQVKVSNMDNQLKLHFEHSQQKGAESYILGMFFLAIDLTAFITTNSNTKVYCAICAVCNIINQLYILYIVLQKNNHWSK